MNWSLLCLSLPDHLVSEFRLDNPNAPSEVYQTPISIAYQHQWILDYFCPSYSWFFSWFHHKIHLNLCHSSVSCLLFSHVLSIFFEDKIIIYVTLPYSSLLLIFNFSFLSSWHWLNSAIQSLHFIASHHTCWPFFHSLSCDSCSKFLIYCEGFFSRYSILLWYVPLKPNNLRLQSFCFCRDHFTFLFSFVFILIYHAVSNSLNSMLRPVSSALHPSRSISSKHSCQNF